MKNIWILLISLTICSQALCQNVVEINKSNTSRNFDGLGVLVSYGKLLHDYPQEQRDQILDYLFLPNYGANIQILKIEMGYDGNNTAISWPSHRRTLDEPNNFNRGYGWWYMKEAKKRNPNIILSALHWGYPAWALTNDQKADFVVDFVEGSFKEHGLLIDYIGGNQNEIWITPDITKKIRQKLDAKGFKQVKIIAADEGARVPKFSVLEYLENDKEYADVVDVIGVHYKDRKPDFMPSSAYELGKPIWSSEDGGGSYAHDTHGYQWIKQLTMLLADAKITGVIRWLSTASIYENMPWSRNGIMNTKEPWSGHYQVGSNVWAFAHFTQFIKPGWKLIETSTKYLIPEGKGGVGRFIAYCDKVTGDYSIVVDTKDDKISEKGVDLSFKIAGGLSTKDLNIWRSCFSVKDDWFIDKGSVKLASDGTLKIHLDKDCVYTLSTTNGQSKGDALAPESEQFSLPYTDNFDNYQSGDLPKYFVNANAVFEVAPAKAKQGGNVLRQVIAQQPMLWHPGSKHVAQPVCEMGDLSWKDYSVEVDVLLESKGRAILGARVDGKFESNEEYDLEGYWLTIDDNGAWTIFVQTDMDAKEIKASGKVKFGLNRWTTLGLQLIGDQITASIAGKVVATITDSTFGNGNVSLSTLDTTAENFHTPTKNYTTAQFDNLKVINR